MSNFHATELDVIRWAEANDLLTIPLGMAQSGYAFSMISTIGDLCDAITKDEKVEISEQMGRVAIDMIVLCAMLDIDLAKSLETAFNKISAKPVDTSNVVLLKRE